MAVSKQNQTTEPWKDVIYVDCEPNYPFDDKNGEMLSSIVAYTLKEISNSVIGSNAEELYQSYCNSLEKNLGSSEPHHVAVKFKKLTKSTIIKEMKKCLKHKMEKIDSLIEKTADEAVAFLARNTNTNKESYSQNENRIVASEFLVLKIFKLGKNLQLVPCYIAVKEEKEEVQDYFQNSSTPKFFMDYKQQKFTLSKDNIEKTNSKLQQGNESMEICKQNQIGDLYNEWLYENCKPDLLIDTQKVSSIVNYALKAMGISTSIRNTEQSFQYYCIGLKNRLKSSEPYYANVEIKEMKKDIIFKNLKQLLPQEEKFDGLIEKAVAVLARNTNTNMEYYRRNGSEILVSELVVLRIFKSGENLELIPSYITVKEVKEETNDFFQYYSTSKFLMDYKQQKFILSKFDIINIIKKLQGEAKIIK